MIRNMPIDSMVYRSKVKVNTYRNRMKLLVSEEIMIDFKKISYKDTCSSWKRQIAAAGAHV